MDKATEAEIDSLIDGALESLRPRLKQVAMEAFTLGRRRGAVQSGRRHVPAKPKLTIKRAILETLRDADEPGLIAQEIINNVKAKQGDKASTDESIRVTLQKMKDREVERRFDSRWALRR